MRKKIVELAGSGVGISEISRLTGFSRKTIYKWLLRSEEGDASALLDRSRAPHNFERFDGEPAEWLLEVRRKYPRWGPTKLLDYAGRKRPKDDWPSRSTVAAFLQRRGMIGPRPKRTSKPVPFRFAGPAPTKPNARWTMDFKGDFRLGDGAWVKPFTLRDAASRMVLDIRVTQTTTYDFVKGRLIRAFCEFGMPDEIQSDTGSPFASTGLARLSRLSVWLLRHDVMPVLSRPGKPQDNGGHERMHRDYKADATRPPAGNARAQQRRSNRWKDVFNEERPHAALRGKVPADCWTPSERKFEAREQPLEYPGWWQTRRVSSDGVIYWHDQKVPCSRALRGETIGLEPIDDGLWTVHFASFPLGTFNERSSPTIVGLQPSPTK